MSGSRTADILKALHGFFSGFLPSYGEGYAPRGAALPYITYQMAVPDALGEAGFYARVWYGGRGYEAIAAMVDAIGGAIGPGCCLPTESGGAVWIYKDERFAQFMPMEGEPALKCAYLSMKLIAVTA